MTATPKQNKGQARGIVLPLRNSSLVTGRVNIRSRLKLLKSAALESVVLAHPDFSRPFVLSTDASLDGPGAVTSQVPEGGKQCQARPIAVASRSLTHAQTRYPGTPAGVSGPQVGSLREILPLAQRVTSLLSGRITTH